MVPEAPLEQTEHGLWPADEGWFVVNAQEIRWNRRPGRGYVAKFTGESNDEVEARFPQLGVNLVVLEPGEPMAMYHWEADQEDFLILSGEALLIVEGQERPLQQWDFFHCPPRTNHVIVGAGDGPCVLVAMGARQHQDDEWGGYSVDEAALRHNAGVEEETNDASVAYARFAASEPVSYPGGLPS